MTRCQDLEEQLSLYVDDLLAPSAAAEVRAHLETCAACAGLAADLSCLARSARLLGPIEPPAGLYAETAARLPHVEPGAASGTAPGRQLWRWAGVAATLLLATALAYVAGGQSRGSAPDDAPTEVTTSGVAAITSELELAVHHYERAITELESLADADDALGPEVAASVRRSLGVLDAAIAESRVALEGEPGNEPARISLFEALRRKIDLLQATALIVNDSQGNPAGPSRSATVTGRQL